MNRKIIDAIAISSFPAMYLASLGVGVYWSQSTIVRQATVSAQSNNRSTPNREYNLVERTDGSIDLTATPFFPGLDKMVDINGDGEVDKVFTGISVPMRPIIIIKREPTESDKARFRDLTRGFYK